MVRKKREKEFSVLKSIGILFLYLIIWWILLTLINLSLTIPENTALYHFLTLLRIAVPILVVLFGVPIILIIDSNKKNKKRK